MSIQPLLLLALAVAARVTELFVRDGDICYRLVPRSMTGGGLLAQPGWLDLAVPVVFLLALGTTAATVARWRPRSEELRAAAGDALWLLAFPLLMGLSLYVGVERWLVTPVFDLPSTLRFIQFVLAFAAMNVFMDDLALRNRWARGGVALILAAALAFTQDLTSGPESAMLRPIVILSSIGTLLGVTAWALRRAYRQSPARALVSASLVGAVACFVVAAARSNQISTLVLPSLALVIGAATIRSSKPWPRRVALGGLVSLGLFISLVLPRLLTKEQREGMVENAPFHPHVEYVGRLRVSYDDLRVRDVAVRLARVLDAANAVSRDVYGVSPDVAQLHIGGIAPGGFFAKFPDGIEGNLPSEQIARLMLDRAFLDAPTGSVDDLDPVNAILHEYAHLYGVVPYLPWIMGPEEEGWATYAATQLSQRLFERHGAALWDPPYDYARRARAIVGSNLRGRAVLWSHLDEYGGFRLWHALGLRDGEQALFRRRWGVTDRGMQRFLLMFSRPAAARRVADTFGRADFVASGRAAPVRVSDAVSRADFARFAESLGTESEPMKKRFEKRAGELLHPGVVVPASRGLVDGGIAMLVLVVGVAVVRRRAGGAVEIVTSPR